MPVAIRVKLHLDAHHGFLELGLAGGDAGAEFSMAYPGPLIFFAVLTAADPTGTILEVATSLPTDLNRQMQRDQAATNTYPAGAETCGFAGPKAARRGALRQLR